MFYDVFSKLIFSTYLPLLDIYLYFSLIFDFLNFSIKVGIVNFLLLLFAESNHANIFKTMYLFITIDFLLNEFLYLRF